MMVKGWGVGVQGLSYTICMFISRFTVFIRTHVNSKNDTLKPLEADFADKVWHE